MMNPSVDDRVKIKMVNIMKWVQFYRQNIHRFVDEYLHIELKLFQKMLLIMMDNNLFFQFWAARGIGKTFLIAVYCVARCILYPGTQIVIASGSREQAQQVIEKIMSSDIKGRAKENLVRELRNWKITPQDSFVEFYNDSKISVVASNDRARGRRCQILIVDEFRLVDKEFIQDVLQPFTAVMRQPPFLQLEPYKSNPEKYLESNKEIYMSSAWYRSHWSYDYAKMYLAAFLQGKEYFICGLPYQLSLKEGLTDKKQIEYKMQEEGFSPSRWEMERECIFYGESDKAYFDFVDLDKARNIVYPIYPQEVYNEIDEKKLRYPLKKSSNGELRILTVDVALMNSNNTKNNDATAIFVIQLIQKGNDQFKQYERNVIYADSYEGGHAGRQALPIRRLFEDFECDYLVLDTNGNGMAIFDYLVEDILDKDRLTTYPALSCLNNEDMAARCNYPNAKKVIYAVKATAEFNSQCAVYLNDDFKLGKIHLLLNCDDGERALKALPTYREMDSYIQAKLMLPYVHTHALIDEMVNLEKEVNNNTIKLKEQSGKRKDRYSSLSYGNYFVKTLERNLTKPQRSAIDLSAIMSLARRPEIYKNQN